MRKYYLILVCLLSSNLYAQIKNPEFKLLLDSLYQHNIPLISVDFSRLDKQNLYLLDTREEKEFNVSHIKNVFNLYGGIFEWVNQGHPVYKQNGVQTSEIHTFDKAWSRWVERGTKVE